jgi:transcription termination factor Rho
VAQAPHQYEESLDLNAHNNGESSSGRSSSRNRRGGSGRRSGGRRQEDGSPERSRDGGAREGGSGEGRSRSGGRRSGGGRSDRDESDERKEGRSRRRPGGGSRSRSDSTRGGSAGRGGSARRGGSAGREGSSGREGRDSREDRRSRSSRDNRGGVKRGSVDHQARRRPKQRDSRGDFSVPEGGGGSRGERMKPELVRGILEIGNQGFGFLRDSQRSFRIQPTDVHVGKHLVQRYRLRSGHYIVGTTGGHRAPKGRGPSLNEIHTVDGDPPQHVPSRPFYKDLTSIDPTERFQLGLNGDLSMRLADLIAPIGRGQRSLIVAPPRTGKTVLLQKMAQSITHTYPDVAVVTLLVDERPEEVTDWKRSVRAEVYASSSDENSKNHVRVAEMVLHRCHRLLEAGCDVVLLLDSLTRLGRAYNLETAHSGRTLSGGVDAKTLEKPKAIFGAARNVEGGGSLTIIATALIETGSRMDEVIFEEFKGTGNMELVLSRKLADHRVFPAIDVTLSGTRKEEKLYSPEEIDQIWKLRRVLTNVNPIEGMELLSERVGSFENNDVFLTSLKA